MYILFESNDSRKKAESLSDYDGMGYTFNEKTAIEWVNENPDYRTYKYVSNIRH